MSRREDAVAEALADTPVEVSEAGPTFEAPWQARAFGVAVALCEREDFDLQTFQARFAKRIDDLDPESMQDDVESTYYEQWLDCLVDVLLDAGVIDEDELASRAAEFTEGERDAAEFVVEDLPERSDESRGTD